MTSYLHNPWIYIIAIGPYWSWLYYSMVYFDHPYCNNFYCILQYYCNAIYWNPPLVASGGSDGTGTASKRWDCNGDHDRKGYWCGRGRIVQCCVLQCGDWRLLMFYGGSDIFKGSRRRGFDIVLWRLSIVRLTKNYWDECAAPCLQYYLLPPVLYPSQCSFFSVLSAGTVVSRGLDRSRSVLIGVVFSQRSHIQWMDDGLKASYVWSGVSKVVILHRRSS